MSNRTVVLSALFHSDTGQILVGLNVLSILLIGSPLLYGIIHFEYWGGDPQKRTLLNKLGSFLALFVMVVNGLTQIFTFIRVFIHPLGHYVGLMANIVRYTGNMCIFLANIEIVAFKGIQLYKFNPLASINDDFWFAFLVVFNILVSLLIFGIEFSRASNYFPYYQFWAKNGSINTKEDVAK